MGKVVCYQLDKMKWEPYDHCTFAIDQQVHVWKGNIASIIKGRADTLSLLDADEIARYNAYTNTNAQDRFVAGRTLLRRLLGKYLQIDPAQIQFETNNHKPFVASAGVSIQFNLAHSGNIVLIAFASYPVGIDVEKIDEQFAYKDLLPLFFSAAEQTYITEANNAREVFYKLWTRKEALLKATGKAIEGNLSGVPSLDGVHPADPESIGSLADWMISCCNISEDYVGSVAYTLPEKQVVLYDAGNIN